MFKVKEFGICNLAVVPLRVEAKDEAEMVSQLLFGDCVEILEYKSPWVKVKFHEDGYLGWMDFKQLHYLSKEAYQKYAAHSFTYLQDPLLRIVGPRGVQNIMMGSKLPPIVKNEFILGEEIYSLEVLPNQVKHSFLQTTLGYLNTPYLWGGKSIFGIDCSGLVQNVFKVHGKLLTRDAATQVNEGIEIHYEDRQIGDVPFFINKNNKIHHVGILSNLNEIVHASGSVRVDSFDKEGIYRSDMEKYTHQFHSIRRYIS